MQGQSHRTIRAIRHPGTGLTGQNGRITTPIQKNQRLLPAQKSCLNRGNGLGGEALVCPYSRHIDEANRRQNRLSNRAAREVHPVIAPGGGVMPGLERWGRTPQQDRNLLDPPARDRQITP